MFESRFYGKEPVKPPTCPFCGLLIESPKELNIRRPGEMPVGTCPCGAVYAVDETGHNLGAAMIEALVFGCNMDWDLAWGLLPEEDYRQEIVENYDLNTHLLVPGGFYEGRRIGGALYFVRLHKDILEVTAEGRQKRLKDAQPASAPREIAPDMTDSKGLSKREVERLVASQEIEPILIAARQGNRVLRYLQRLLYSGDDLFRKKAADALGRTCGVIGDRDPAAVSKLLQGLFYAITDTAAFSWGAFEAIGEIIANRPDLFGGYAPQLYQFLADTTRKAQALQALGRIAQASPEILRKHTLHFFAFLEDSDPEVRGYAAWLMGNLHAHEAEKDLQKLLNEYHEIKCYTHGQIETMTVGRIAAQALRHINEPTEHGV
jgi:hypothetical protein